METPEEDHGDHESPMNSSSDNNLDNSQSDPEILPDIHRSHDFLETLMGVAGNVLEWYDFAGAYEKKSFLSIITIIHSCSSYHLHFHFLAVFGYFSDIIGDVFFPPQSGHSQTIESFAVFGLAFVMRPIGT